MPLPKELAHRLLGMLAIFALTPALVFAVSAGAATSSTSSQTSLNPPVKIGGPCGPSTGLADLVVVVVLQGAAPAPVLRTTTYLNLPAYHAPAVSTAGLGEPCRVRVPSLRRAVAGLFRAVSTFLRFHSYFG